METNESSPLEVFGPDDRTPAERLAALNAEVDRIKRQQEDGARTPVKTVDDIIRDRNAMDNVIGIGEVMESVVEGLRRAAEKSTKFADRMREEIAQTELESCIEHPEVVLSVDSDKTFAASWREQRLHIVYAKCPKCSKELKQTFVNERWTRMGVPDKVLHATFDNFDIKDPMAAEKLKALKKTKRQVSRDSGFLILRGKFGAGKSHLAVAAMKEIGDGIFVTEADLVKELRQTYADKAGPDALIEKYRRARCLVLDELTVDVTGKDVIPLLYLILGYRYDKDALTIITSNDSITTIMETLGGKLADRVTDNYEVATCEWESYRGKT